VRLVLEDAEQRGLAEAVEPLKKIVADFPDEPEVQEALARVYGRLGWRAERLSALADLARRFPDDVAALRLYLDAIEEDGSLAEADALAVRVKQLDPDSEVDLDRAVARQDWPAAIAELRRLSKRRPDRKEIVARIADVLARGGDPRAAAEQLEKALKSNPRDSAARFRLADGAYSRGDHEALRRALAESLQVGADTGDLRAAIDLLEGATDLEPYRKDGREIIKQFEAWEKTGKHMEGTTARVLDYGATWVHIDGSSEMLEHEIQRIQSQEGINEEANIDPPPGLVLHLRVIKPDGTSLEPEVIAGKQQLTFPHLEVGDYIELEHITPQAGDGMKGRHYLGPTWFFREPNKGYWWSEFVVVTPKDKEPVLEVEHRGNIGNDTTRDLGMFVEHRWRVDLSPPAPEEPGAPLYSELLPSVRLGWGVNRQMMLERFADLAVDDTPLDPRLRKIAEGLVRGTAPKDTDERAKRLYRFAVDNVQSGKESDGRRVLMGRAGSTQAAYLYLLRLLDIQGDLAIVKNRLATPPLGQLGEAEDYDPFRPRDPQDDPRGPSRDPRAGLLLRVATDKGVRWLEVGDKFIPFGYVPANYRGQPAFRLVPGIPGDTVAAGGAVDSITYSGRADVRDDGAAKVALSIAFSGDVGISIRRGLESTPEARRFEVIDRNIVAAAFAGANLREMHIDNLGDVDQPVVLRLTIEAPELAKPVQGGLSLGPLFRPAWRPGEDRLSKLAELPERVTPLLRVQSAHTEVHIEVAFTDKFHLPPKLPAVDVKYGGCEVSVQDTVAGHAIYLERLVDLPAGRVQPGDDYAKYQQFARDADAAYERETVVGSP
jgi:tetratricopeptide (TPR) repeat protein